MEPEPASFLIPPKQIEMLQRSFQYGTKKEVNEEEPFNLNSTSIGLLGSAIAIALVGVPLIAVLTERPIEGERHVPNALKSNGSKLSPPISLPRVGEPSS